jgi:hypothetical protein
MPSCGLFLGEEYQRWSSLDLNALAYANSRAGITQGLVIVGLLIPMVLKMKNMDTKKKVAVAGMFAWSGL